MCAIIVLTIVLLCAVRFSESYGVVIDHPNSSNHYEKQQDDQGNYNYVNYGYNSEGNKWDRYHQETGTIASSNSAPSNVVVRGEYYYTDNHYVYRVVYKADENGYHANFQKESEQHAVTQPSPATVTPSSPPRPPMDAIPDQPIGKDALLSLQGGR